MDSPVLTLKINGIKVMYSIFKGKKSGTYKVVKKETIKFLWWKKEVKLVVGYVVIDNSTEVATVMTQSDKDSHYRYSDLKCLLAIFDRDSGEILSRSENLIGFFQELNESKNIEYFDKHFNEIFKNSILIMVRK